ncbi:Ankyrin repeat domain containing protein [Pandoravirus quercus]|uniref:Ankyrin repeat domain containing protein n=1 Tax=Pandoravirus quercus TaxID=2107709 RepID=A0A2U7U868_9VIRU|nr:Ankyrin repeat domain containing protein [Pandoravirus quercus]AVK74585.1 Ankyrin repeat domain containing protein [Pandoravirus quercus]
MLNADPPHSFAMQALPSAVGNLIAYVLGWGPWRVRRPVHAIGAVSGVVGAPRRIAAPRSRDAVGRTALYRALVRGNLADADRMLAEATTPQDFMVLAADPLTLSSVVAADNVAAVILLGRHAKRVDADLCRLLGDPHMCDPRAGGTQAVGALDAAGGDALVHLACATDSAAVLTTMLLMGVNPEHRCSATRNLARASTPLHVAARAGSRACAAVLLGAGASPNAQAADAMTPLHEAAAHGHTDLVRLLLASGGSTMARRRTDTATPAGAATHAGYPSTAAVITAVSDVRHSGRPQ